MSKKRRNGRCINWERQERLCRECKEWKPFAEMVRSKQAAAGIDTLCLVCSRVLNTAIRKRDPQKKRDKERARWYEGKYGISAEEADAMKAGGCEVCGEKDGILHIDHCHETGLVRGCLCILCNTAYGKLKHSRERILALLKFHEEHSGGSQV